MADENLSFAIVLEEATKLVNDIKEASGALEEFRGSAVSAASGLDDAAKSAISGAAAFDNVAQAAAAAGDALKDVSGSVDLEVDSAPLEQVAAAAENAVGSFEGLAGAEEAAQGAAERVAGAAETAGASFEGLAQSTEQVISDAEFAALAMDALGVNTGVAERQAKLCADALDALNRKVDDVESATAGAEKGINRLGATFSNLGTVAKAAIGSFVGLAALEGVQRFGQAIGNAFRTAIGEAIEAERAVTALDAALQSTGQFSREASQGVREFADEIARTTTFTDDAVTSAAALIAQVGQLGGKKLIQATEAAVQLSAVLGRDLQQSALLLARGAAGATEAFSRFGIVVKGAGSDAEKFDSILAQISTKFGGRAQADAKTFGGSIQQLRNSWKELLETVGSSITVFQPVLSTLTAALQKANKLLGIETVNSALDGRAAIGELRKEFQELATLLSQKIEIGDLLGRAPGEQSAFAEIGDATRRQIEAIRALVAKAEFAIPISIVGGENIQEVERDIENLRRAAEELGNVDLQALVQGLQFALAAGKQQLAARIELEGQEKAKQGLKEVIDLIVELRGIVGATPLELIDTTAILKAATDVKKSSSVIVRSMTEVEEALHLGPLAGIVQPFEVVRTVVTETASDMSIAARSIRGSVDAIISAAQSAVSIRGDVSGAQISQGLEALDKARESIVKEFGEMPAAFEAAFNEAQNRLQAAAKKLRVDIEIGVVGGFGQSAIDALVAGFDQAEAEVNKFKALVESIEAAAGTDLGTKLEVRDLLQKAKTIQDITPLLEAALARLRAAIALETVVGGPAATGEIDALFAAALQGEDELEKAFGDLSAEAQVAFTGLLDQLRAIVAAFPELQGPTQEFRDTSIEAADAVAAAFGASMGSLIQSAQEGTKITLKFFVDMVASILKELEKIGTFDFLGSLLGPIGGILGGIVRAVFKAEVPPITVPLEPIDVPTPTVPTPEIPKATVPPIEISISPIPSIELPEIQPIGITVTFSDLPSLPDLPAIEMDIVLGEIPSIPIPEIAALVIPVEPPEIASVEIPIVFLGPPPIALEVPRVPAAVVEAVEIPIGFGPLTLPLLPDTEGQTIDIAFSVTAAELPEIEPPQVGVIEIAIEVGNFSAPEVEPLQVPVNLGQVPEIILPNIDPIEVDILIAEATLPDLKMPEIEVPVAIQTPEAPAIVIPVLVEEPNLPELEDVQIPIIFALEDLPRPELPGVQIPVEFLLPDLPGIDFPQVTVPVNIQAPEILGLETIPLSLAFARQRAIPEAETVPASLEFARLTQEAARETRLLRREAALRVRERIPAQPATAITINATDGISVRRQLTAGALRREIERDFRRSGF